MLLHSRICRAHPRSAPAVAVAVAAAFASATLLAAGCKDEKKITPPPPPSDYLEQSSAANVLANLHTAYEKENIEEYEKLLSQDFVFVFNPAEVGNPENPIPQQWVRRDEMDSARNLFSNNRVQSITLSWSPRQAVPSDDVIPGSWKVRVDAVNLSVYTRNENGELWIYEVKNSYQVFYFREHATQTVPGGAKVWHCIRWDDMPIGGFTGAGGPEAKTEDTSWGQIKALFKG